MTITDLDVDRIDGNCWQHPFQGKVLPLAQFRHDLLGDPGDGVLGNFCSEYIGMRRDLAGRLDPGTARHERTTTVYAFCSNLRRGEIGQM